MSNEVTTTTEAPLPDMYGGGDQVDMSDIIIPRIETVQGSSALAKDGIADEGDIVHRYGSEDVDPTFLVGGPDKIESFVGYVLLREKFAATTAGGGIEFHPTPERDENDPDSWQGWFFYIALPEIDEYLPAKWMLWRTAGAPAARQINTMLQRAIATGNTDPLPIKVSVRVKHNKRGNAYMVPVISPATADPDHLRVAREIRNRSAAMVASTGRENAAPKGLPAGEQPSYS